MMTETLRITRRIIAASNSGRLAEDVLACPDYDHESIEWGTLARWSVERQEFLIEGDVRSAPRCVGCGRHDMAEEAVFLTPARIAQAAAEALAPRSMPARPVDYRCSCCGSSNMVFAVMIARDPFLARDVFRSRIPEEDRCQDCGHEGETQESWLYGKDRHEVARAFAKRAKEDASALATIRKLAGFLAR